MSETALASVTTFVSGLAGTSAIALTAGAAAGFGVLFIPSSGPQGRWVNVGGRAGVSYFRNPDELGISFRYTGPDGKVRTIAGSPGGGGFRGPDGRQLARWVRVAGRIGLVVSTGAFVDYEPDQPKVCPTPLPDRNPTDRGRAYEDFMKRFINPENPTPSGFSYYFPNAVNDETTFDDCHHKSGDLFEYKGPGYESHYLKHDIPWQGMLFDMMEQAIAQNSVKGNRRLTWVFHERRIAIYMNTFFKRLGLDIHVVWSQMPGQP